MTLIDVDHTTEPLDLDKVDVLKSGEYPYCILGFQLKNSYDQERIKLKTKYKSRDIIHLLPTASIEPVCFRGLKLEIKADLTQFLTQLRELNTSLKDSVSVNAYKHLLNEYGLTCNECYAYLRKGVYPVDGSCLGRISTCKWSLEELYNDAFDNKIPFFQSFSSFTIFILCNETVYA